MSKDATQFMKFIGLLLLMGLAGRLLVEAKPPGILAIPFGILWIFSTLAGIGYIIDGKSGAKALVGATATFWAFMLGVSAFMYLAINGW